MANANNRFEIIKAAPVDAGRISELILPLVKTYISYEFPASGEALMLNAMSEKAIYENLCGDFRYTLAINDQTESSEFAGVLGVKGESHIYHLFVAEAFHRQGVAKALWDNFLAHSEETLITVNSSRYAVGYYESLGFTASAPRWQKNGVTCYPMVFARQR